MREQAEAQKSGRPTLAASGRTAPKYQYLADIYAERYTTFDALRMAMVHNGIVDHGINPYDVIQRAIDDTTTDYLLLRRTIDKETNGDPELLVDHPLYHYMEQMREAAVRYATFATQYDIQRRQLKLSESRVALLSHTLRDVLQDLGMNHEQIREVPKLLIQNLKNSEPPSNNGRNGSRLDATKAEAIAEILHHDAEVSIMDADPITDADVVE
jgi:hypothetical protein